MTAPKIGILASLLACSFALGCGDSKTGEPTREVSIDGSSTVAPISEAAAEEFGKVRSDVKVTVGTSGTGGGFKKFANGEIHIAGASRPIEQEEVDAAKKNGVDFVEIPVAFDGLTVVVNPKNTFVDHLTVDELKRIWITDSKVKTWADVRAGWPAEEIKLYGPGTDSGTFDYFTEAICGKKGASRSDYTASENDNVLVQGVVGDEFALGYFGYSYFQSNQDQLRAVPIGTGGGSPVHPSPDTIADASYQPLSRPLFLYVNVKALDRQEVADFLDYVLTEGRPLLEEVGYVKLSDKAYELISDHLSAKKTGSKFKGAEVGVSLEEILKRESK